MKKLTILAMCMLSAGVYAQSLDNWVVGAGGESKSHNGIQLSWTLGETNISAISTSKGWLTEGFHQPQIEVMKLETPAYQSQIKKRIELIVYPNPAIDLILIDMPDGQPRTYNQRLTDLQGRTVSYARFDQASGSNLSVSELSSGIYFLNIQIQEEGELITQSFKIIKQ